MLKTIYLYLGQHKSLVSLLLSRENIFLYSLIKQLYFDIQSWRQGAPDRALAERELGHEKNGARQLCSGGGFPVIARRRGDVPPRLQWRDRSVATHPWVSLTRVPDVSVPDVSGHSDGVSRTQRVAGDHYRIRTGVYKVNTSLVNENSNKLCLLRGKA